MSSSLERGIVTCVHWGEPVRLEPKEEVGSVRSSRFGPAVVRPKEGSGAEGRRRRQRERAPVADGEQPGKSQLVAVLGFGRGQRGFGDVPGKTVAVEASSQRRVDWGGDGAGGGDFGRIGGDNEAEGDDREHLPGRVRRHESRSLRWRRMADRGRLTSNCDVSGGSRAMRENPSSSLSSSPNRGKGGDQHRS